MASSGNFATINFQAQSLISTVTPTLGNLKFDGSTLSPGNYNAGVVCNFGMTGGKWYWEVYLSGGGSPQGGRDWSVGFAPYSTCSKTTDEGTYGQDLGNGSSATLSGYSFSHVNASSTGIRHNNSTDTSAGLADHTSGDVLGFALDLDNGTWIIYRNGSSLGTVATGIDTTLTYFAAVGASGGTISNFDVTCNFGQDSTFGGAITAGGNADGNGFGDFKYSVPSGYLACSTANLSVSDDIDPAQTDDDFPSKNFNAVAYTGNGTSIDVDVGLQPDLCWIKIRGKTYDNLLIDSSRGLGNLLKSNTNGAELTGYNTTITSFNSDGFTYGSELSGNENGSTHVAWCWRANGGTTSSNSSGDITSTVQANTKAGFSICTYTANGSANQTWGHGLSAKPDFIIVKKRSATSSLTVYHSSLGATKYLYLNSSNNVYTGSEMWNNTEPTSSLVTVNNNGNTNDPNGATFVSYVWHNVEGFQKFGSYEGNGNADGPFVYTGFRPKMIFTKSVDSASGDWIVIDTARSTFNVTNAGLSWNENYVEATSNRECDILSNGFKIRTSNTNLNKASETYIYGAWGDVPFKYNNTF
jgi:hypothetical protein